MDRQLAAIIGFAELKCVQIQFGSSLRMKCYQEVAALLTAGYSQGETVEILWRLTTNEGMARKSVMVQIYSGLRASLRNGLSLCEAMGQWIPSEEYMILRAMEEGEDLARGLDDYCQMLEMRKELQGSIMLSLGYPLLLMLMGYGLLVYFSTVIAPELDRIVPVKSWHGLAGRLHGAGIFLEKSIPHVAGLIIVSPLIMKLGLIHWTGKGRNFADHLPFFAGYRTWTGSLFLQSLSCLMANGLSAMEALRRIIPVVNPYLRGRLEQIQLHMLNGDDLGLAMGKDGLNWPDRRVALSVQIFAQGSELSRQIRRIAETMMKARNQQVQKNLIFIRGLTFMAVFSVILGIIWSMYDLQSQMTSTV